MAADNEEHEGASVQEQLVEACRRNNTDLLAEIISTIKSEDELSRLLNETTTVMGNHLYHEAASRGNYEIIDLLLDQPNFECDPINRLEGDTPLHSAIRWINSEPPEQHDFGNSLIDMMLEAGSNPRVKNRGGLTAAQLVDPRNPALRDLIQKHDYATLFRGDFVNVDESKKAAGGGGVQGTQEESSDDENAYSGSGSDNEEVVEWERRRRERKAGNMKGSTG